MINKNWDIVLSDQFQNDYFKKLDEFIKREYETKVVYPNYEDIFNALRYTDYDKVKVVIIGQDPYHGKGEAHGLAFSTPDGVKRPPSLINIFKELRDDLGIEKELNNLIDWAKQGVLLLNCIMSVEENKALSHAGRGWEEFTDNIIKKLNERDQMIIFVLWGNYAKNKKQLITNSIHKIVEGVHPSPLSANRGFFGSKPFSKINKILQENNQEIIKW